MFTWLEARRGDSLYPHGRAALSGAFPSAVVTAGSVMGKRLSAERPREESVPLPYVVPPPPKEPRCRSAYIRWIGGEIAAQRVSATLLEEFLAIEDDFAVAVEAAIELASLHAHGAERLVEIAAWDDLQRPGAPLGGLLFCGDAAAILPAAEALAECSPRCLRELSSLCASRLLVAEIEIWLSLAERFAAREDPRVEIVATALQRLAERRRGEDAVRYRTLGLGRAGPRIVAECPFQHLASYVGGRIGTLPQFTCLDRAATAWTGC